MTRYIARRLLISIPVLLGVSFLVFAVMHMLPGDALTARLSETGRIPQEDMDKFRHQFGLDRPLLQQYGSWIGGLFRGDFGTSLWTNKPVMSAIMRSLPITAELVIMGLIISLVVAIPLGVISAIKQNSWTDYLARLFSISGLSLPDFWIATVIILYMSIWFHYLPPVEYRPFTKEPLQNIEQFLLPSLLLGFRLSATTMRMMRSAMLEVLRQDYVRTAWAKGLRERNVMVRHALKNAMIPVVTIIGGQFAYIIGGTVIEETIFALPGMGLLTLQSILNRDYTQLQGSIMFLGIAIVAINLLVDVSYAWLDPRIRFK